MRIENISDFEPYVHASCVYSNRPRSIYVTRIGNSGEAVIQLRKIVQLRILTAAFILGGCNSFESRSVTSADPQKELSQASPTSQAEDEKIRKEAVDAVVMASKTASPLVCDSVEYFQDGERLVQEISYRPDVINAKLRFLPEAKRLLGVQKVATCADAKRFIDYMNEHPELTELFDPFPAKNIASMPKPDSMEFYEYAPLKKTSLLGGVTGDKQGTLSVVTSNGDGTSSHCTGVLLDYRTLLTSAHCVDKNQSVDNFDKHVTVSYFDPFDASSSPRVIYNATAHIHVHPPYTGIGDYQSDLAVVATDGSWNDVDIYDNIRIYNDVIWALYQSPYIYGTPVIFWGAGRNSNSTPPPGFPPPGLDVLRYANSKPVDEVYQHHVVTHSTSQRLCYGDSGLIGQFSNRLRLLI